MPEFDPDWRDEARAMRADAALWLRPDAHLWIRPDADRFMPPGWREQEARAAAIARGEVPTSAAVAAPPPGGARRFTEAERRLLLAMRDDCRAIAAELRAMREALDEKALHPNGYDPAQPRWPAGTPGSVGGQWSGGAGTGGGEATDASNADHVRLAQADSPIKDVDGTPYYQQGGHHEAARGVFNKWNLKPETRRILEKSTTGKLPTIRLRTSPDGIPMGNFWGPAHRAYNSAIEELATGFL